MHISDQKRMNKELSAIKFPKRFDLEGLDPLTLKVKTVVDGGGIGFIVRVFENLADFFSHGNTTSALLGPMADKHDGQWCIRFECKNTYNKLSQ